MPLISELASYDHQRVERNVTDLLWFYDDAGEAEASARSFLFSLSPDFSRDLVSFERYDSLEVLWHLLSAFDRSGQTGTGSTNTPAASLARNRLLVIGGYGWGKSSLALVASCFLGLSPDNPCYLAARAALDPESGDTPRQLVDKREGQKPKFTICIKGAATDFHSLFITAVARSKERYRTYLEQHKFEVSVKCEYDAAAAWLRGMREAPGFNDVLTADKADLAQLLGGLAELRPEALAAADRIYRAHNRLQATAPAPWSLNANTADYLSDLVTQVTDPGSPFDGVLVIFDEVGLWVEHANEKSAEAGVARFLDFMERASRHQGKLAVCSFIQFDVESYIGQETAAQNVKHISERLGVRIRYRPDLELVFQKAVRHKNIPPALWRDHKDEIDTLTDSLIRTFTRYTRDPWAGERDQVRAVVQRCWPIHPFMVAAACHLRFGQGARVLSLLESQFPRLNALEAERAAGELTWSVPVEVVDYFHANFENFKEHTLWDQYDHARNSLRRPENDPRSLVLKAVFLCHSLERDIELGDPDEFPALVAKLAGLDEERTREILLELSHTHGATTPVLLLNENSGWYEFFAPEQNPVEAQRTIARLFDQSSAFDLEDNEIRDAVFHLCPVTPQAFTRRRNLDEHSFQAWHQSFLDVNKLTAAHLIDLVKTNVFGDLDPECRGIHVVVLYSTTKLRGAAEGTSAVETVRQRCRDAVSAAWAELKRLNIPTPLAISFPTRPPDELYRALAGIGLARGLPKSDQERLGQGLRLVEVNQRTDAKRRVTAFAGWAGMEMVLPESEGLPPPTASPSQRVAALYGMVYTHRPPLKHSELGTSGNKFVKYCHALMGFLMGPSHDTSRMVREHINALQSVLVATPGQEETSWMAVVESGGSYKIQEPANVHALKCYQAFDAALRAITDEQKRTLREVWKTLSVAPYGLDIRSFALMFGIWYSRNREACELIPEGSSAAASWEMVVHLCERKPDFMKLVNARPFLVRLRDLAAEAGRVRGALERVRAWDNTEEQAATLLAEVKAVDGLAPAAPEWDELRRKHGEIERGVGHVRETQGRVEALHREIQQNATLDNAAEFLRRLSEVEKPTVRSQAFRSAVTGCLRQLRNRLDGAADAVLKTPYPSLDVEQHELRRATDRLRSLAFNEVASAFGLEDSERQPLDAQRLLDSLREAEQAAPGKYRDREERVAATAAFRSKLNGLWPPELSPLTLSDLQQLTQKLDELAAQCPDDCKSEYEDRRRSLTHRVNQKRDAIRDCLVTFQTPGRTPDQVRRSLEEASRLLPSVDGTEEAKALAAVTAAAPKFEEAIRDYLGASARTPLARHRQAAENIDEIAQVLPSNSNQAVLSWSQELRDRINRRETSVRKQVEALQGKVRDVRDATAAARLLRDIRVLGDGDAGDVLPGEAERLEAALGSAFAEIAPVQVAEVLRPLGAEARAAAIARALELLKEQSEP